jgi:hypothetical protein
MRSRVERGDAEPAQHFDEAARVQRERAVEELLGEQGEHDGLRPQPALRLRLVLLLDFLCLRHALADGNPGWADLIQRRHSASH